MDSFVFFLVLISAMAHATYSAAIKGRTRAVTEIEEAPASSWDNVFGITLASAALAFPFLLFLPAPAPESWVYFIISGCTQLLYMNMVARVFAASDYATGYPLMRGMGAFFATAASILVLGDAADGHVILSVGLICAGILFMAFTEIKNRNAFARQFKFALVTCFMLAALVTIDVKGARLSGSPIAFGLWVFMFQFLAIFLWRASRKNIPWATVKSRLNWIAGACSVFAYCVIMWSVTKAPASMVLALRESSILFSILISAFFLKEHLRRTRWIAAGLIAAGVISLKFV